MNNIYYSKANKKVYYGLVFSLIGLALIYTQNIIFLLVDLFFIVFLYEGILNRDIFIRDNNKLYLAIRKDNILFGSINLCLLMLVFSLSVNGLYIVSLLILFSIFIELFIYNILISSVQGKTLNEKIINDILNGNINKYKVYCINKCEKVDKGKYIFYLNLKANSEEKEEINYNVSKYLINYMELLSLLDNI